MFLVCRPPTTSHCREVGVDKLEVGLGELGELGDGFGPEGVEKLHVNGGARNVGEVCIRVRVWHNRLGRAGHSHGDFGRCGTLDCAAGIKLDDALHSAQLRRLLH